MAAASGFAPASARFLARYRTYDTVQVPDRYLRYRTVVRTELELGAVRQCKSLQVQEWRDRAAW